MRRFVILGCVLALAASCSSSRNADSAATPNTVASSPTTAHTKVAVDGHWLNATPAVSLGTSVLGFKQRSGTRWTGDLTGTTTYVAYTRSDPKHRGAGVGTINEIFTGSVRGVGRGHLYLSERFTVVATGGAIRNVATITRGDGDLTGIAGGVVFIGTLDVNADGSAAVSGLGRGTYTGTISR